MASLAPHDCVNGNGGSALRGAELRRDPAGFIQALCAGEQTLEAATARQQPPEIVQQRQSGFLVIREDPLLADMGHIYF